ncbi:MAG: hypothetical protein R2726_17735 [Acidimicrobiales bacterium]
MIDIAELAAEVEQDTHLRMTSTADSGRAPLPAMGQHQADDLVPRARL